ncbi:cramped protein [Holotrichia oblita]|uniref:Cramped protein n=1 Tax=Holotrichia oblita TaxID=644536 RepID=A0ACB9T910_HOLOL|nr:cramped protein [Holotrichia oblita]
MSNRYRTAFKEILCGRKNDSFKLSRRSTYRDTRISQCEALRLEKDSLSRGPSQKESSRTSTTLLTVNGGTDKCLLVTNNTNGSPTSNNKQSNLVCKISFKNKRNSKNSETYI